MSTLNGLKPTGTCRALPRSLPVDPSVLTCLSKTRETSEIQPGERAKEEVQLLPPPPPLLHSCCTKPCWKTGERVYNCLRP
jgi:hypothetical protein